MVLSGPQLEPRGENVLACHRIHRLARQRFCKHGEAVIVELLLKCIQAGAEDETLWATLREAR